MMNTALVRAHKTDTDLVAFVGRLGVIRKLRGEASLLREKARTLDSEADGLLYDLGEGLTEAYTFIRDKLIPSLGESVPTQASNVEPPFAPALVPTRLNQDGSYRVCWASVPAAIYNEVGSDLHNSEQLLGNAKLRTLFEGLHGGVLKTPKTLSRMLLGKYRNKKTGKVNKVDGNFLVSGDLLSGTFYIGSNVVMTSEEVPFSTPSPILEVKLVSPVPAQPKSEAPQQVLTPLEKLCTVWLEMFGSQWVSVSNLFDVARGYDYIKLVAAVECATGLTMKQSGCRSKLGQLLGSMRSDGFCRFRVSSKRGATGALWSIDHA